MAEKSSNGPKALGPNSGGQNTTGPKALGPNSGGQNTTGPKALGRNVNNPVARGLDFKNPKHVKLLGGFAFCCCICCTFFIIPTLLSIIMLSTLPNNRIPSPRSVEFGTSRFDVYCNHTYNPLSARPTRQTVGNRSFVTNGFDVYLKSYQYVVHELCRPNGLEIGGCTGSIIDSRHILTAAHCVTTQDRMQKNKFTFYSPLKSDFIKTDNVVEIRMGVVLGRSDASVDIQHMQVAGAESIYVHSNYDEISEGGTDIALIRLNKSLDFNEYVKPVCLAGPKDDLPSDCVVIGFGKTELDDYQSKLYRAPNVSIYSSHDCSIGELAKVTADQLYDYLKYVEPQTRYYFDLASKWYIPIVFRDKICSLTNKDGRNVCQGDSGGPLLCTPKGVASNKEYHNPSSPLFRKTDPTLKQFGITQSLLLGRKCGEHTLLALFMSVKDLRLWLEYIAWPALQDQAGTKTKEIRRFEDCWYNLDFVSINKIAKDSAFGKDLPDEYRFHICRKFNSYMHCADNSPKLEHCDHLFITIVNNTRDWKLYVDLLPFFKAERCRQQAGAVGC